MFLLQLWEKLIEPEGIVEVGRDESNSTIVDEIREKLPLSDMLDRMDVQHVKGNSYLCPFHEEENPSFWIHGDRWTCGHGEAPVGMLSANGNWGGDVIDLAQYHRNLDSRSQTIAELGDELGLPSTSVGSVGFRLLLSDADGVNEWGAN